MIDKGNQMSKYTVHQLPFEHSLKRDMGFLEAFQYEELSDEYVLVGLIQAKTLDEAFRIGNFVCEDDRQLIEFTGEMHSISTGDILCSVETGDCYVCMAHGWDKIEMKEEVL